MEKLLKVHHFWKIQLKTNRLIVGPVLIFDHIDLFIAKDFFNLSAKITFFSQYSQDNLKVDFATTGAEALFVNLKFLCHGKISEIVLKDF